MKPAALQVARQSSTVFAAFPPVKGISVVSARPVVPSLQILLGKQIKVENSGQKVVSSGTKFWEGEKIQAPICMRYF
jgi:hypothetical protein